MSEETGSEVQEIVEDVEVKEKATFPRPTKFVVSTSMRQSWDYCHSEATLTVEFNSAETDKNVSAFAKAVLTNLTKTVEEHTTKTLDSILERNKGRGK